MRDNGARIPASLMTGAIWQLRSSDGIKVGARARERRRENTRAASTRDSDQHLKMGTWMGAILFRVLVQADVLVARAHPVVVAAADSNSVVSADSLGFSNSDTCLAFCNESFILIW